MVKIDFEMATQYGTFKDALYLPDDHNLSELELETLKKDRADAWVNHVVAAANEPPTDVVDVVATDTPQDPPVEGE